MHEDGTVVFCLYLGEPTAPLITIFGKAVSLVESGGPLSRLRLFDN